MTERYLVRELEYNGKKRLCIISSDAPLIPIAEVSPKVTWIRQYYRLPEDVIQLFWQPGGPDSEDWNLVPLEMLGAIAQVRDQIPDKYFHVIAKIQCPHCKHFH